MNTISTFVKRYQLVVFFVLAFAFAWFFWIGYAIGKSPIPIFAGGPLVAAFVVTAIVGGKRGLIEWASRIVRWRVHVVWYAVALLLPIAVTLVAVYANVALGAPTPQVSLLTALPGLGITFLIFLVNPLGGPLGEEPGWRGFALPRMLRTQNAIVASLVLGVIWAAWHLPLFVTSIYGSPLPRVSTIIAEAILYTWLFKHTCGSVLLAILFHASIDTFTGFFFAQYAGVDLDRLLWLYAALDWIVALIVIAMLGLNLARKPTPEAPVELALRI